VSEPPAAGVSSDRPLELATIRVGTEYDLAFTLAALAALEIPHYVRNEHFGAMRIGPRIAHFNERWIEIPREHLETVHEALVGRPGRDRLGPRRWDGATRLRALAELLLFGWFVPGRTSRLRARRAAAVALVSTALVALAAGVIVALLLAVAWASGRPLSAVAGLQQTKSGEARTARRAGTEQDGRTATHDEAEHRGGPG
jgi:hypothetical protein